MFTSPFHAAAGLDLIIAAIKAILMIGTTTQHYLHTPRTYPSRHHVLGTRTREHFMGMRTRKADIFYENQSTGAGFANHTTCFGCADEAGAEYMSKQMNKSVIGLISQYIHK